MIPREYLSTMGEIPTNKKQGLNSKLIFFLLLFFLFLLSLFIRTYGLSLESLYGDEMYSVFHGQKSLSELKVIFLNDQNPPMHIALLHFWMEIFGVTEIASKMLSVACSVFAGLILFLFAKKFLNIQTAVIAFFLFLFSNSQHYFSTEVRPYALIQLLCISSFYIYFNLLTKPKKSDVIFLWLINLSLLFTHYLSVFILVVQFVFIWGYFKENRKAFVYYFVSQIFLVISFLPWVSILLSNVPKEGSFWNIAPNFDAFRYHTNVLSGSETLFYVFSAFVSLSFLIVVFNNQLKVLSMEFNRKHYFVFVTLYILPIVLDFIVSQKTPVFHARYILYTTIGLFLCIAYFFSNLKMKFLYKFLFIIPFALLILTSFEITQEREDDWKRMVPVVKSKQDKNTVIFISATYKYMDFAFYYDYESFRNYSKSAEMLAKNNVYYCEKCPLYGWENLNYDTINKVIYVHSHSQFQDPDHKIEEFIVSKGFKECSYYKRISTGYTVFVKNELACNPIEIIADVSDNPCDLVKSFIGKNVKGDSCLVFHSSFMNAGCNIDNPSIIFTDTGRASYLINEQNQFSPGIVKKISELNGKTAISINALVYNEKKSIGHMVISVEKDGESLFRADLIVLEKMKVPNNWNNISLIANLPSGISDDAELKIYVWNRAKENFYIENFKVVIQKGEF
ncbi:MAG: glycosyltransferase family 39 protein [Bacteroidetes bacterium]|nr:glycosyltransferase family 39 protein [Bacteroidota bacterium]HET6245531.1 glycosyltransferase family 39 protein [Bacteroidia bacterium]